MKRLSAGRRLAQILLLLALLAATVAGCGGKGRAVRPGPAPLMRQLALLPDLPGLRRQLLFGDLGRLRAAYPDPADLRRALGDVWLPDALVGGADTVWRRSFGFDLGSIERFAAGGFHPGELLVASGHFGSAAVRATLEARGYALDRGLLQRGRDGSLDTRTSAGRLALSSLNRVAVHGRRLIAASTTALARAATSPRATLAAERDLAVAAAAFGEFTAAALFPSGVAKPVGPRLVFSLARHPAVLFAIGVDDRGPSDRTLKLVIVYRAAAQARADAELIDAGLADVALPSEPSKRFGDVLEGPRVEVLAGRAILVIGRLRPGVYRGFWRGMVEAGDLAAVIRRS